MQTIMIFSKVSFELIFPICINQLLAVGLQIEFKSLQLVAATPPLAFTLLFKHYLKQRFSNDFEYYLPRHEEITRAMLYSDQADMAERKLETRYDHPVLDANLFTPLVHAKDMPVLHRLLKGKNKEMNLARETETISVSTKSMREDDASGVHLTPVDEVTGIIQYLLRLS